MVIVSSSSDDLPGPRGLPILGNVLQNPLDREWLQYTAWGKQFGNIFKLNLFRQNVIIINSRKVAVDLLEKRSAIYSDRPRLIMAGELVGWNKGVTLRRPIITELRIDSIRALP